tara:strand:+ start:152 stop:472 length:321 start_codon:yes stop_codon:yes gene_type:complete
MTIHEDSLLVLENDVPLPQDNRMGNGESLPSNFKQVVREMAVSQSFFIETEGQAHTRAKINAIRSSIRRLQQDDETGVEFDKKFSVRKYPHPSREGRHGLRVYRIV